jgi:hypothetical protein
MRISRAAFTEILHFVEVAAIVSATIFAGFQLHALRNQNSADLALRMDQEFETRANEKVMDALDSEPTAPILKRAKGSGSITVLQLDGYLGQYETLDDFYRNGLITCGMMYNEFSYDLENAYKNKDVMNEVAQERKDDPTVWEGFIDLGKAFDNDYHCQ